MLVIVLRVELGGSLVFFAVVPVATAMAIARVAAAMVVVVAPMLGPVVGRVGQHGVFDVEQRVFDGRKDLGHSEHAPFPDCVLALVLEGFVVLVVAVSGDGRGGGVGDRSGDRGGGRGRAGMVALREQARELIEGDGRVLRWRGVPVFVAHRGGSVAHGGGVRLSRVPYAGEIDIDR